MGPFLSTMDDLLLLQPLALQHWLEAENNQDALDTLRLITAILIVGSNEDHLWAVADRRTRRQYLGRPALLPNPRFGTPWTLLYASYDDRAFDHLLILVDALEETGCTDINILTHCRQQ